MSTIYVRVSRVSFSTTTTITSPIDISVGTLPRGAVRSSPTKSENPHLISCKGLWTCHPSTESDDKFAISITRNNKRLATVVVPFFWIPNDLIVSGWFPMKLQKHKTWKHAPFAYIRIHLDTKGAPPFKAPKGRLLVTPAWNVPKELEKASHAKQQSANYYQPPVQQVPYIYQPPIQQQQMQQFYQYPIQQPAQQPVQQQQQQQMYYLQYIPQQPYYPYVPPMQQSQQQPQKVQPQQNVAFYPPPPQFASDDDVPKVSYPIIQ